MGKESHTHMTETASVSDFRFSYRKGIFLGVETKLKHKTYSMSFLKCSRKLTFEFAHAHHAALSGQHRS